jgi:putative transposase
MAVNRAMYGLEKPKGPAKEKREMPFAARRWHQLWSADVRYLKGLGLAGRSYVITVLDNHSRAILSSAVIRSRDLTSYLSVLYGPSRSTARPRRWTVWARVGGSRP